MSHPTTLIPVYFRRVVAGWTQVDTAAVDWLNGRRLKLDRDGYAKTSDQRLVHRVMLGLAIGDPLEGDHINGDRLDNRRENLRVATRQQNGQNVASRPGSRSRYRGVGYDPKRPSDKKWRARIAGRRGAHIGWYLTEDEAGAAALAWLEENFPFAQLDRCVIEERKAA